MLCGSFSLLKCQKSSQLSKGIITKAFVQVVEEIHSELVGKRLLMNAKCYFYVLGPLKEIKICLKNRNI